MKTRLFLFGIATSLLLLAGCATPVSKTEITPTGVTSYRGIGKTVSVLPVVIRPQPAHSVFETTHSMPDADLYREAIISTLQNTGIFSDVKKNGKSDYSLSSEVIGERLLGTTNNVGLFLIRYELTDAATRNIVWSENIFSYSMLSAQAVFLGHERAAKVIELAVRSNMAQLATGVGEVLTTPSR